MNRILKSKAVQLSPGQLDRKEAGIIHYNAKYETGKDKMTSPHP